MGLMIGVRFKARIILIITAFRVSLRPTQHAEQIMTGVISSVCEADHAPAPDAEVKILLPFPPIPCLSSQRGDIRVHISTFVFYTF